ncbi:MAG: hypothetical protein U1A23_03125 [Candidatus Sungbacteria bacterium]|nr:hypothetical protein [Candidatus Sungbacteria bacterium]
MNEKAAGCGSRAMRGKRVPSLFRLLYVLKNSREIILIGCV